MPRRPPTTWRVRWATVLLAALVIGAVVVPLVAPTDPRAIGDVLATRLLPPFVRDSAGHIHWLGSSRRDPPWYASPAGRAQPDGPVVARRDAPG